MSNNTEIRFFQQPVDIEHEKMSVSTTDHQEHFSLKKIKEVNINAPVYQISENSRSCFVQTFEQFCSEFGLDKLYGSCINYHQIEDLPDEYLWIQELILCPEKWRTRKALKESLEGKFPPTPMPELTERQAIKLVSATFHMINVYLFCRADLDTQPQTVPAVLSVPHVQACAKLRLEKLSLGFSHMFASWKLKDPTRSMYDINNYGALVSFTDSEGDRVFNGLSIVLTFHLQRINANLFDISAAICNNQLGEIASKLREAASFLSGFIPQMKVMFSSLETDYFMQHYRFFLQGFDDQQRFPSGLEFEGTGVVSRTTGGSAGGDPCVQIFERLMGLKFPGIFDHLQDELKMSFIGRHKDCVNYLEKHHVIRKFLLNDIRATPDMIEGYNELLEVYAGLFRKHYSYVHHYLLDRKPAPLNPNSVQGTGGIKASDLGKKASLIDSFKIPLSCPWSPISANVHSPGKAVCPWSPITPQPAPKQKYNEDCNSPLRKYLNNQQSAGASSPRKISRGCPFGFK